jgi:hypothetical protein
MPQHLDLTVILTYESKKPKTTIVNTTPNFFITMYTDTAALGLTNEFEFGQSFESDIEIKVTRVFHDIYAATTAKSTNEYRIWRPATRTRMVATP